MMDVLQIQTELLRQEYPHLLPDEDIDIERYFFLRNSGYSREAMNFYQIKLKPRYPDDKFRAALLKLYRNRSPLYRRLQAKAYRILGARSLERMKRLIVFTADRVDTYNPRDLFSTIKAAKLIRQVLPQERYEAIAAIERFSHYSQVLNLRPQSLHNAVELIRGYLTDTLDVVNEERRRQGDARKRALEESRRRNALNTDAYGWGNGLLPNADLMDAVNFSSANLARIEIPAALTRSEDKTLAYCAKYWNHTEDRAFERILFLYSRKFSAKNYEIYKAIQQGKRNNKRDDEILASVMTRIITGYYYSVLGDRYVQRRWVVIKAKLLNPSEAAASGVAKPVTAQGTVTPPLAAKPAVTAPPVKTAATPVRPDVVSESAASAIAKPVAAQSTAVPPLAAKPIVTAPPVKTAAAPVSPASAPEPAASGVTKPATAPGTDAPSVATRSAITKSVAAADITVLPLATEPFVTTPPIKTVATPVSPAGAPEAAASGVAKPVAAHSTATPPVAVKPAVTAPSVKTTAVPPKPATVAPLVAAKSAIAKPAVISPPAAKPVVTTPPVKTTATPVSPAGAPKTAVPVVAAHGTVVPPLTTKPVVTAPPIKTAAVSPKPASVAPSVVVRPAVTRSAIPTEIQGQSVSQRLQELSGRSYDVFQDRFLAHVRTAIRKVLGAKRGIFFIIPPQAEDIVFNFLKTHYNDPYMNWEKSDDRANLAELGFELKSVIPVIDECYRML
jgi:hypothetical protein